MIKLEEKKGNTKLGITFGYICYVLLIMCTRDDINSVFLCHALTYQPNAVILVVICQRLAHHTHSHSC
jgi:hypothetical protein